MKYLIAVALLGTVLAVPAATAKTAGELRTSCLTVAIPDNVATQEQEAVYGLCLGYIDGVTEGLVAWYIDLPGATVPGIYSYTFAPGVTLGQEERVFVQYMEAHPEREKEYAPLVLRDALCGAGLISEVRVPNKTAAPPPTKSDKGCKKTTAVCLPT